MMINDDVLMHGITEDVMWFSIFYFCAIIYVIHETNESQGHNELFEKSKHLTYFYKVYKILII